MNFAIASNFHFEPFRKCIRAFCADTVQTAGIFVGALTEFAAGVQIGEDKLNRGHFPLRMNIDRNTAAVVAH